jgi:hypothetical protein
MQASRRGSGHQGRSINALIARSVVPASWLNLSEAICRPSTTSSSHLYSTGTLSQHNCQRSTVLPNHPPPACTFAQWHSVEGSRAPGLVYAGIFLCDIPRIPFAFRLRAPNPYQSVSNVACRRRWKTSMGDTTAQTCVSGDGRENGNMWLPCIPRRPLDVCLWRTGKNWKGWRFKYLGQLIAYDDADTQAMRSNLRKARGCWARISHVLRAENANARTCGMFYTATVQAVLLYGSKTWSLSPTSIKRLEGFHICAMRQMTGMRPEKKPDGSWLYPCSKDVLEAAGLQTIAHYMGMRRQTVANFIVN